MAITATGKQRSVLSQDSRCQRVTRQGPRSTDVMHERDDLERGQDELRTILDTPRDIVFQLSPGGLIEYVSPNVKEIYGYDPQGLIGEFLEKTTPASEVPKALDALNRALAGEAILNLEIGQLDSSGNVVTVEMSGAPIIRDDRVIAIQGVMRDITLRKEAEEAARSGTLRLVKAMEDTMQAMAMIVEMRDPYTAGHQRRVSQLACAIGQEMRLSPDLVTGLRLAGLIHDIGKVRVPAEILTNPNALSDAEMTIIKMHPTLGYDVLKTLDLPWPVAQSVHQHHERMDGSGYPLGLAGEAIIVEARVLAVADVVEAIASHRPYRPARGIDEALGEVLTHKGDLYDAEVADACARVFEDQDFQFQ